MTIADASTGHVTAPASEVLDPSADPIPALVQGLASSEESEEIVPNEPIVLPELIDTTDLAIYTQRIPIPHVLEGVIVSAPSADTLLQALRKGADWCFGWIAPTRAAIGKWRTRMCYGGKHRVERRWYGRMRSTAERTGIMHREHRNHQMMRLAEASATSEDDLCDVPLYWIGWAERFLEVMRDYDEALHPTTHHRFICS